MDRVGHPKFYNPTRGGIMKTVDEMDKQELKEYAKKKGIRLYTTVLDKMRNQIKQVEYTREHHGDAFRY